MPEDPSEFQILNDEDLQSAVRSTTGYEDSVDELPTSELKEHINDGKRDVFIETDSTSWFEDLALGQALKAHTAIIAKVSVENFSVSGYSFGDISINTTNVPPEESKQLVEWARQAAKALEKSEANEDNSAASTGLKNTSSYIP